MRKPFDALEFFKCVRGLLETSKHQKPIVYYVCLPNGDRYSAQRYTKMKRWFQNRHVMEPVEVSSRVSGSSAET